MQRRGRLRIASAVLVAALVFGVAACGDDDEDGGGGGASTAQAAGPIRIGAAVDQSKLMQFFDGPALAAAQIRAEEINAAGGVDGRMIEFEVKNTRLDQTLTRNAALDLVEGGAEVLWVTCDVDWATPSTQVGIQRGLLTVAPCIGTDQMGPKRFGEDGKLAFSFGNVAQDEGAAMAALAKEKGWSSAVLAVDQSIAYTQNVCQAFANRFEENGGTIAGTETFTEGDGTIANVVSRVNRADADTIVICATTQNDLPAFVSGVRGADDTRPILGPWSIDGGFWLPKSPRVSDNIFYVTYASVYGDDPDPKVRELIQKLSDGEQAPATGGFVTGAAAIDGIVAAIQAADGSTDGAELAQAMEGFTDLATLSGPVSFSDEFHSVFGRTYRVIEVKDGKPGYVQDIKAGTPASL